jgi:hypothetical protein
MPAKDLYHDLVHRLLVADGWTITHDPYRIVVGRKNLFVDLARNGFWPPTATENASPWK